MRKDREQRGPSAVVWVDEEHAIVASSDDDGCVSTEQVDRGAASETEFLAHVVHEIGNRPTVSVVGPSAIRLAMEREFVRISHRPERLVGVPASARIAEHEILERMRRLAA